jgi:hypothetical protein
MISSLCSTTAKFFFLLFVHFTLFNQFDPLCYHMHQIVSSAIDELKMASKPPLDLVANTASRGFRGRAERSSNA